MSVTTILVPVSEQEAEALLNGDPDAAATLIERAGKLRTRVAGVDAVRDELHDLLFSSWEGARQPPRLASAWNALVQKVRTPEPPALPIGYDPFVQLFGRSLPVEGASSKAVADRLRHLLTQDEPSFRDSLVEGMRRLNPTAGDRLREELTRSKRVEVAADIEREIARLQTALSASSPDLRSAYTSLVRLSAWSQPVWRLDGEMLPELLDVLGVTVKPGDASPLFEELVETRPDLAPALAKLPRKLLDFAGGGAYFPSASVKLLAGSLRLNSSRLLQNAGRNSENPTVTLRHLRLLMEAAFFCENESLGLAEADGVEWHDRSKAVSS